MMIILQWSYDPYTTLNIMSVRERRYNIAILTILGGEYLLMVTIEEIEDGMAGIAPTRPGQE